MEAQSILTELAKQFEETRAFIQARKPTLDRRQVSQASRSQVIGALDGLHTAIEAAAESGLNLAAVRDLISPEIRAKVDGLVAGAGSRSGRTDSREPGLALALDRCRDALEPADVLVTRQLRSLSRPETVAASLLLAQLFRLWPEVMVAGAARGQQPFAPLPDWVPGSFSLFSSFEPLAEVNAGTDEAAESVLAVAEMVICLIIMGMDIPLVFRSCKEKPLEKLEAVRTALDQLLAGLDRPDL